MIFFCSKRVPKFIHELDILKYLHVPKISFTTSNLSSLLLFYVCYEIYKILKFWKAYLTHISRNIVYFLFKSWFFKGVLFEF